MVRVAMEEGAWAFQPASTIPPACTPIPTSWWPCRRSWPRWEASITPTPGQG